MLRTDRGDIDARYHPPRNRSPAPKFGVVYVGGAGGGLDGPAGRLYPALCEELQNSGVAGLRIDYRRPNELPDSVLDTLFAIKFLESQSIERIALVGHSFGGAVVISAAASSRRVYAVIPMSSQTYGAELAPAVAPRPMLLIHGTDDDVLPDQCSRRIFAAAREPKELRLFEGAGHGLDLAREEIVELLVHWIPEQLARARL